jgi:uncharacterized protein YjbI with pentapeptide repeats
MAGRLWRGIRGLARFRWPLAGLAALAVILACVLVVPLWLVHWELGAPARTLPPADKAKAINDIRATLLQGIGGAVILLGAYFTYRQLQTGREQLQVAQQGQVTERFTRAIDQLGHTELDVRLGGIYALERIANDSPNDRIAIAEVLTAFVRGHAPWPPRLPGQYLADAPIEQVPELQVRAPDVQAALTVLGRRQPLPKLRGRLDLEGTDLRKARLEDADFQQASLFNTNLQEAILDTANLQGAILYNANLQEAMLDNAQLQGASFDGARLQGAHLHLAQLQGAILDGANLEGADLSRAQLQGSHLHRAQLQGANLHSAQLQEASLVDAELKGALLRGADLQGANLNGANLQQGQLEDAQLQGTHFNSANLQTAVLRRANLQGARLRGADLQGADLSGANLQGAHLDRAQLQGAHLLGARFDNATIWPASFDVPRAVLLEEAGYADTIRDNPE